ncbi:MAG: hypothetical protein AYK18_02930 [Theionarchaea archaeon DG-70]|nr:MAG: hypothetical protein AYK18_02930 [Theionarchaea archaeon DG-70]
MEVKPNIIIQGDCLDVLQHLKSETVDLIYIDPPFSSNRNYTGIWEKSGEELSFEDVWELGVGGYIDWLRPRVEQCFRVLKETGSFYIHCDTHASHEIKSMIDRLVKREFRTAKFRNEIIWKRTSAHSDPKRFGRIHDTIFFYTKSDKFTWNQQYTEYSEEYKKNFYRHRDAKGRLFRLDNLIAPGKRGPKYEFKGVVRYWRYTKEKMLNLDKEGRIWHKPGRVPAYIRYLDEMPGVPLQDIWVDIAPVQNPRYPTEKPIQLLERIVNTSSNNNDVVLDAFCGCGTTLEACARLGRKFIGIDISRVACKVMDVRLKELTKDKTVPPFTWQLILPETMEDLKKMDWQSFQDWACEKLGAYKEKKKSSDMGRDGYYADMSPIQVKQWKKHPVGRPEVQQFHSVVRKSQKKFGTIVGFAFSKEARVYAADIKRDEDVTIELLTVDELLKRKNEISPYKKHYKVDVQKRLI